MSFNMYADFFIGSFIQTNKRPIARISHDIRKQLEVRGEINCELTEYSRRNLKLKLM